jgi:hypothetical protein
MKQGINIQASNGDSYVDLFVLGYQSSAQGTWAPSLLSTTQFNNTVYNSSQAQNDSISWPVFLQPGTYSFLVMYVKGTNYGIQTWTLGGTTIATIDGYNATPAYENLSTTSITVSTSGLQNLVLNLATKNGSSSAYASQTSRIVLIRTA